jgi:mannose/fructose-specific phosphotransferase system component IIA
MERFIIVTHDQLAEGFAKAIRFFLPEQENLYFINAYVKDQEFEKAFRKLLDQNPGASTIVFSDLPGGSVNQVAARLMREYGYSLITGINLSLLLEVIMAGDHSLENLTKIVDNAKEQIILMNSYQPLDDGEDL